MTISASLPELPVSHVLPAVAAALEEQMRAVLSAPPGAGKTTLVPLHLLGQAWRGDGKIILLEPRRLAARAAAGRMASLIGEQVGETVGYRMRLDNRISAATRIEVVTEGVFARMILDDPELTGVSVVIFDEFHERSLDADFGLALALDVQSALRDDLRILVMSATLDVERVAALLDHPPVIESLGRSFPIDVRYQDRPGGERIEDAVTRAILDAHANEAGSILAFLPGQAEITRTVERLQGRSGAETLIAPLYGNLSQKEQDAAIRPASQGTRKIVLATSIAETSITIDGVRIVIDSGLQRLPVFEASTGITRLETVRVSRASADQRAGRAGRTEPGIAVRLWHQGQTAALPAFTPPQILSSDLSGLVLDLAHWGVQDPASLAFVDQPPETTLREARVLLGQLGALDKDGALKARGKVMRDLALPPRLAAMVVSAGEAGHARDAAMIAVLLTEQGLGGTSIDIGAAATLQGRAGRESGGFKAAGRTAGKRSRQRCLNGAGACRPAAAACVPRSNRTSARRARPIRNGERAWSGATGNREAGRQPDAGDCRPDRTGSPGADSGSCRGDTRRHRSRVARRNQNRGPDILRPTEPASQSAAGNPTRRDRLRRDAVATTFRGSSHPGTGGGSARAGARSACLLERGRAASRADRIPSSDDRRALA
ncbi:ATP-dependent helicase HrpB [Rhizobium leguminosarum]|nr:ATP-dependent helicase HrpB [Rhizobium leguminosarum]